MYKLFCNNVKNYLYINDYPQSASTPRMKNMEPIITMTDPKQYSTLISKNPELYAEVNNLIYEIGNNTATYVSFKAFSWELWGYGFDMEISDVFPKAIVKEQLKLVDLLLSCHYWIVI